MTDVLKAESDGATIKAAMQFLRKTCVLWGFGMRWYADGAGDAGYEAILPYL